MSNLPNLEILKVAVMWYSYDPDDHRNVMEYHRDTLDEALRTHNHYTLQTAQVDVFICGKYEIKLEVQFQFVRGSEGRLVAAQKSDRAEFRMKRLVSFDV